MANISDYLSTAKKIIHNAIEAIGEQDADKKSNVLNKENSVTLNKSIKDQDGNTANKIQDG